MPVFLPLLEALTAALATRGLGVLQRNTPFPLVGPQIAEAAFRLFHEQPTGPTLTEQLLGTVAAEQAEYRNVVRAAVASITRPDLFAEVSEKELPVLRERLTSYLDGIPDSLRRLLRRPADPAGKTLPNGLTIQAPEDLLLFLPQRLPQFRIGERPQGMGQWELVELLGVSTFGEVWKARHTQIENRFAVVKFFLEPTLAEQLRRHAKELQQVMTQNEHPGIVAIQDADLASSPPWLRCDFVADGDLLNLADHWRQTQPTPPTQFIHTIIGELAVTLGDFHTLAPPMIHRALTPGNILIQRTGPRGRDLRFRIADFTIGALTPEREFGPHLAGRAGAFLRAHTPTYASPQQRRGLPADPRDDVYSLGMLWYQLLIGDLSRDVGVDVGEDLQEAGVTPRMIEVVRACLASNPSRRPENGHDLASRILPAMEGSASGEARVPSPAVDPLRFRAVPPSPPSPKAEASAQELSAEPILQASGLLPVVEAIAPLEPAASAFAPPAPAPSPDPTPSALPSSPPASGGKSLRARLAQLDSLGLGPPSKPLPSPPPPMRSPPPPPPRSRPAAQVLSEVPPPIVAPPPPVAPPPAVSPPPPRTGGLPTRGYATTSTAGSRAASPPAPPPPTSRISAFRQGDKQTINLAKAAGPSLTKTAKPRPTEVNLVFTWIPPGRFRMGSPPDEPGRSLTENQHDVVLTQGFFLAIHPITQLQWTTVMGSNPSRFPDNPELPIDQVSWFDCEGFCRRLSETFDKTFRLPTEAEWEYACRAGTKTAFAFGDRLGPDQAYFKGATAPGEPRKGPVPVASYKPNAWGLYDMHGNVWEWCLDGYAAYPEKPVVDPCVPPEGEHRIVRGGSWNTDESYCRSARRSREQPTERGSTLGFRIVMLG